MTAKPVAEVFYSDNTDGGYDFAGSYFGPGSQTITDSGLEAEDEFFTFDANQIAQYASALTNVTISVTYTLTNSDFLQNQPIDVGYSQFSSPAQQALIESDTDNPTGDSNDALQQQSEGLAAYNFLDLEYSHAYTNQVNVKDSTVTTTDNITKYFAGAGNDIVFAFSVGSYPLDGYIGYTGLTNVTNISVTVVGISYVNLPVISDTSSTQPFYNDVTIKPFAAVTLADPGNQIGYGDTITITIQGSDGVTTTLAGRLTLPGNPTDLIDNGDGSYTIGGTLTTAGIQADLEALVFVPAKAAALQDSTFVLSYASQGGTGGTTTDSTTKIQLQSDPRKVTLAGAASGTDRAPFTALQGFAVVDPISGDQVAATITVQAGTGTLSGNDLETNADGTYSLAATDVASLNTELQTLTFTPTEGLTPVGQQTTAMISVAADAADGWHASATETLSVTAVAGTPSLDGGEPLTVDSEATSTPFSTTKLTDTDFQSADGLTIQLSDDGAGGALFGAGLSYHGGGTYTLFGVPSELNSQLQALLFTPAAGAPNSATKTIFTLSDTTAAGLSVSESRVSVTDIDKPVAPMITGSSALQVQSEATSTPFATATVADPNSSSTDRLEIVLSNQGQGGRLSGSGLVSTTPGVYKLSGAAADVTSQLQALVFTPTQGAAGSLTKTVFTLTDAAAGNTSATSSAFSVIDIDGNTGPACYCGGTLILTERGEVVVEALSIGDRVITASGATEPVRWIGWRSYTSRFLAGRPNLLPILFRAGSLGEGLPRRDLRVSPLHAMLLEGVLIPANCLVNGTTILPDRDRSQVDYFHVELAQHDAILAEGAPSETFLDDDSRGLFHNANDFATLYPDATRSDGFFAPRVTYGYALENVRQRLAAVAIGLELAAKRDRAHGALDFGVAA